ncbi:MAG TPA: class IV adenylate cyclase [Dehalococcoidia bacterium]|nr:class IV adenylate cyclase [Dehalococcoidia bacterium]
MKNEIEVKLPIRDPERLRERLRAAGATCEGSADEDNIVFDRGGELHARNELLRLRRDRRVWLTWKGPASDESCFKSRLEAQITVGDFDGCREILERLGYRPAVSYAKHREVWEIDGVEECLDRLAFGDFVEIEGAADRIQSVAAKLGLDLTPAIPRNYVQLQSDYQAGGLSFDRYADA